MVTRLIMLDIEISVGWNLERRRGEVRKRRWKYGAADMNMFLLDGGC